MEKRLGYPDEKHTALSEKLWYPLTWSLGHEDPRTLRQNQLMMSQMLKINPDLLMKLPKGKAGEVSSDYTSGWTSTPTLETLRNQMTPEQQARLFEALKALTVPPSKVPVRPAAGAGVGTALAPGTRRHPALPARPRHSASAALATRSRPRNSGSCDRSTESSTAAAATRWTSRSTAATPDP